ncbi:MAG: hypothetical protein AABZ76_16115 [Pseudomonadota bacterium]|uniref:hypothetical protein n=1 Tax=Sphingobium yanoikuyae TaxID=13690 RepID=UPI001378D5F4|nr:hypothetical protein [Sphingobium yanoikuyae]NBB38922.1 hypothetical protein [Sphingobium yanoikuyae]
MTDAAVAPMNARLLQAIAVPHVQADVGVNPGALRQTDCYDDVGCETIGLFRMADGGKSLGAMAPGPWRLSYSAAFRLYRRRLFPIVRAHPWSRTIISIIGTKMSGCAGNMRS